jgi:hypothetical protein
VALKRSNERRLQVNLLKLLHSVVAVVAWLLATAVAYAAYPYIGRFLRLVQTIHDFGK